MRTLTCVIHNINRLKKKFTINLCQYFEKLCDKVQFPFLIQNYLVNQEKTDTSNMTRK